MRPKAGSQLTGEQSWPLFKRPPRESKEMPSFLNRGTTSRANLAPLSPTDPFSGAFLFPSTVVSRLSPSSRKSLPKYEKRCESVQHAKRKVVSRTTYLNYPVFPAKIRSHSSGVDPIQSRPEQRACVIRIIVAHPPVSSPLSFPFEFSFPRAILPLQGSGSVRQPPLAVTPAA